LDEQPATPPPVVAVIVTHDAPAGRLEAVLAALAGQDHPNLDVLVVDTGSEDPTPRVAATLPGAVVRRLGDVGFGAAANTVLDLVSGAEFYVFCHDDAVPDAGAVSAMVAAAARWEADVVGPKLVMADDDRRLAQLGVTVDRVGVALPYVEPGELDQGQHDGLRDVFAVPGAFTLVRAARFAEVGGFDEAISFLGDDISLCWRVRLAGGRVLVTTAARVRHAEAFADRPAGRRRDRLAARHRVRVVLTSYRLPSLVVVVPLALGLSLVAAAAALVTGRPSRARAELAAWPWNVRRLGSLRDARRSVAGFRRVKDRDVRRYQVRGYLGPRVQRLRAAGGGEEAVAVPVRGHMVVDPADWSPGTVAVVVAMAAVLVFGSRHLLTRTVPVVGEMVPLGGGAGSLLHVWASGWRPVGLGFAGAPPPLVGFAGALTGLLAGHGGLARTLLTLGLLPLGIVGAHRMAAPLGAKRAQVAAAVAYAAVPLADDALAAGRWTALGAYAAAPWMVGRLARASGVAPYGPGRSLVTEVVATGLVTALAALVVPQAPLLLALIGAGLAAGGLVALEVRGLVRLAVATVGGLAVAALLQLPTTLDLADSAVARRAWLGAGRLPEGLAALDVLGLRTGPTAKGPLGLAVLGAAAVPLLIGRRWRLAWAVRGWAVAALAGGLVWAREQGAVTARLPDAAVLLAPAAAGLALAVGLGLAAVDHDVAGRSWRLGARRLVVALGVLSLVAATGSAVAVAVVDGRWGAPPDDFAGLLGFAEADTAAASSRVLWVGERDLVPGRDGWPLDGDGALWFTAVPRAVPAVPDLWPATSGDDGRVLRVALRQAVDGETSRLGRRLADLQVEYVAVPRRLAPSDRSPLSRAPSGLVTALAEQLDLERVQVDAGLVLYRNTAFAAGGAAAEGPGEPNRTLQLAAQLLLWLAAVAVLLRSRATTTTTPPAPTPHPGNDPDDTAAPPPGEGDGSEPARRADPAPALAGAAP
jgi:GT2 family glycosyltransferase